jgi:hypothetical protein
VNGSNDRYIPGPGSAASIAPAVFTHP